MDTTEAIGPSAPLRPSLPPAFSAVWADRVLHLVAAPDLSERSWAASFGQYQQALEHRIWQGGEIDVCVVDFCQCLWADPLPLLSLALSLLEFEQKEGRVRLLLPEPCTGTGPIRRPDGEPASSRGGCLERTRLLKFMAREGFLELLVGRQAPTSPAIASQPSPMQRQCMLGSEPLDDQNIQGLRELWAPLAFEESTCVPAILLAIGRDQEWGRESAPPETLARIDDWVQRTIQTQISPVVRDKVPAWAHSGLLYRLQILLRETLHNIAEHAYGRAGTAAVYVRYREGRLGQPPTAWAAMEKHIIREDDVNRVALMKASPIYQAFSRTRAGFFEVFVLDAGRGLIARLTQNGALPELSKSPNPLHRALLKVFSGYSSKPQRSTELGGIYLLRCLLEPARDYLRVRDADTWWGRELPLPMTDSESPGDRVTVDCEAVPYGLPPVRGLAWTARLSWLDRMDTAALPGLGNWHGIRQEDRRPLLAILRNNDPATEALSLPVLDWRLSDEVWADLDPCFAPAADVMLVLPRRDWMKDRIKERLRTSLALADGRMAPGGTLVVGEIISEEALTYVLAIRAARGLFKGIDQQPRRIILVTRDLRVVTLRLESDAYKEDNAETKRFVSKHGTGADSAWSLPDYYRTLRLHDGRRVWHEVCRNPDTPRAFCPERVDWHDGRCLDGYLDFPATLTNPVCRAIYSLSLERLTALFPRLDCHLIPLDKLVESLVTRFRAKQHPRGRALRSSSSLADSTRVYVGSILVTGRTAQDQTSQTETPTVFHFFGHPSGHATGYFLLPWGAPRRVDAPSEWTGQTQRTDHYRRIGRTPAIARGGWKAFRMPRFDANGCCVYEAPPAETYRAWQDPSRTPMKLGHWSYGGHHDLLTVNLLLAFDTELDQISLALGGRLARFVYANLFRALGIERQHLDMDGQRLWDTIERDGFRRLIPKEIGDSRGILIFPSHPVTDHVLDRLGSWIADRNVLPDVLTRCVPILPLRRNRGGSGLQLSGLTLERLQALATNKGVRPVTFFDDAMITGRTFREMKSLLHDLGFHRVYSLTMLDRQRLPSADHMNRPVAHTGCYSNVSYWRLDAPAMGSPQHCPLCNGLGRIKDLADRIRSPERRRRAITWQEMWVERNPATDWGDAGLRPVPLELNKRNRRFGIIPDPDNPCAWKQAGVDAQEIMLTNSAGVVGWVTELYSVTSRDDLALSLLRSEQLPPEARIQLLASQLLLFFGEFDQALAVQFGHQLVDALFDAQDHDRNTALAAITLVACGNEFLTYVMQRFGHDKPVGESASNWADNTDTNLDFLTLLELYEALTVTAAPAALIIIPASPPVARSLVTTDPTGATPAVGSAVRTDDFATGGLAGVTIKAALAHPSHGPLPDGTRCEAYSILQEIVCGGEPEQHSSPFSRLQVVRSLDDRAILKAARGCAGLVQQFVQSMKPYWPRDWPECPGISENFYGWRRSQWQQAHELTTGIDACLAGTVPAQADARLQSCKSLATDILSDMTAVSLAIFTPLGFRGLKEDKPPLLIAELEDAVRYAITRGKDIAIAKLEGFDHRQAAQRLPNQQTEEYFVVWDRLIRNALDRILANVRHADGAFPCPTEWHDTHPPDGTRPCERMAHLWVLLDVQRDHVAVRLRNRSQTCALQVQENNSDKLWVKHFVDIGGDVRYSDVGDYILQTEVKIPYSISLPPRP